jgi:hypothetical protein
LVLRRPDIKTLVPERFAVLDHSTFDRFTVQHMRTGPAESIVFSVVLTEFLVGILFLSRIAPEIVE